jgi:hypothetical protein
MVNAGVVGKVAVNGDCTSSGTGTSPSVVLPSLNKTSPPGTTWVSVVTVAVRVICWPKTAVCGFAWSITVVQDGTVRSSRHSTPGRERLGRPARFREVVWPDHRRNQE